VFRHVAETGDFVSSDLFGRICNVSVEVIGLNVDVAGSQLVGARFDSGATFQQRVKPMIASCNCVT
jgi:hypothetical protein